MTEITREQLTVENSQTTDAVASDFFTKRTLYTESRGLTVVSELYRAANVSYHQGNTKEDIGYRENGRTDPQSG